MTTSTATDKQVSFALSLLAKKGFSTRFMDSSFSKLGASMKDRKGSVEAWVRGLGVAGCSQLIDTLK